MDGRAPGRLVERALGELRREEAATSVRTHPAWRDEAQLERYLHRPGLSKVLSLGPIAWPAIALALDSCTGVRSPENGGAQVRNKTTLYVNRSQRSDEATKHGASV